MLHSCHLFIVLLLVVQFKFEFVEFEFGLKCLNQIQKNAKPFSIYFPGPSLFFHPSGPENFSRGPFSLHRPISPPLAQSGPAPYPPSLSHRQAGPARRDRLPPRPSRTLARVRPGHARRRVPLGPARQGPCSAPIKGTLDPPGNPKPEAAAAAVAKASSRRHSCARARSPP